MAWRARKSVWNAILSCGCQTVFYAAVSQRLHISRPITDVDCSQLTFISRIDNFPEQIPTGANKRSYHHYHIEVSYSTLAGQLSDLCQDSQFIYLSHRPPTVHLGWPVSLGGRKWRDERRHALGSEGYLVSVPGPELHVHRGVSLRLERHGGQWVPDGGPAVCYHLCKCFTCFLFYPRLK